MGFGAAMGVGVDAYQKEDSRQTLKSNMEADNARADKADVRADKQMVLNEATSIRNAEIQKVNMGIKAQQLKLSTAQLNEYNSPEARKSRAMSKKLEIRKMEETTKMYDTLFDDGTSTPQQGSSREIADVQQTVKKMEKVIEDTTAVADSDRVWTNIYSDVSTTGQIKDFSQLNTMIKADPAFSKMIKGDVIKYNPLDGGMKDGIMQMAAQTADLQGGEANDYFPAFEAMAKKGLIAFDSSNGKPFDVMSISKMMGVTNRLPVSLVDSMNSSVSTIANNANEAWQAQNKVTPQVSSVTPDVNANYTEAIAGITPIAPWHGGEKNDPLSKMRNYKGKDPQRMASKMSVLGIPVPEELKAILKENAKIVKDAGTDDEENGYWAGATQEQVIEGLDNIMDAAESGTPITKEMVARAKTGIGSLETADQKNAYSKQLDFAVDTTRINKIFDPDYNADKTDIRFMESTETKHLNQAGDKGDIGKKREQVRADMGLAKDLNSAMSELQDIQKDGGMLSGYMADTLTESAAKDPKLLDKIAELASGKSGLSREEEGKKLRRMVLNTIKSKSRMGMILAKYIKSVSGSAVSDQERDFLTGVLQGAVNGNPKAMATAMQSFRGVLVESSQRVAQDPYYVSMIPSTLYDVKENSAALNTDYASSIAEGTVSAKTIAEDIYKNNSMMPDWMSKFGTGVGNFFVGATDEERGVKPPDPNLKIDDGTNVDIGDNYIKQFVD